MGINKVKSTFARCAIEVNLYEYLLLAPSTVAYVDMSNLLWVYACATINSYIKGDYEPALRLIGRVLDKMKIKGVNVMLVFDGGDYKAKEACYLRRRRKRARALHQAEPPKEDNNSLQNNLKEQISIQSTYIGAVIQQCALLELSYTVAYQEADSQMAKNTGGSGPCHGYLSGH